MLRMMATKWVDQSSLHQIETMQKGSDGSLVFVVRDPFGHRLNNELIMEIEPLPSNRDAEFIERCQFEDFKSAAEALERYLQELR